MPRFAALAALAVAFLTAQVATADDTTLKVKPGDKFPDVALEAAQIDKLKLKDAKTVSIVDLKGKNVVIFFYPKALTGGCTVESCGFRDILKDFPENTVVIGASGDDLKLQQQFIDKNMLPFALLADTELKLINELGIRNSPTAKTPKRVTFVIDKEGKIVKIYDKVTPKDHPKEVLEFVKTLK
jgi:peroxiredoxin Q/BCP